MSEMHPAKGGAGKKQTAKGRQAKGQVIIRKFITKNTYPMRRKVGFVVDNEVVQNGDLPLSGRKGPGSDEEAEAARSSSALANSIVLPDMNPKPFGFRERKVHSIENIQPSREEIAPMAMPTLKIGNKQIVELNRQKKNQSIQDLQKRYVKRQNESENQSSQRKSQSSITVGIGELAGNGKGGVLANPNILGSQPKNAKPSGKFVHPKSLNRMRLGEGGQIVDNDYVDWNETEAAASGANKSNTTLLPDPYPDQRRPGRNFIVSMPKTLGKPDKRAVRARRASAIIQNKLDDLGGKRSKAFKQNNSYREDHQHNTQESPIKDLMSQMYDSRVAAVKKHRASEGAAESGVPLDSDNDYADAPGEARLLSAHPNKQRANVPAGVRNKLNSRNPVYQTEMDAKTNINVGTYEQTDWFLQSEPGIDGTKLANDLSVFEKSHERLLSQQHLGNPERHQTSEDATFSRLPSIVGGGKNEVRSDTSIRPLLADRYKQNYSQLTAQEATSISLADDADEQPRDDFVLATSPRLNATHPDSPFRLKQSKDYSTENPNQGVQRSGQFPRVPGKLEALPANKAIRDFVQHNTQVSVGSLQQQQQQESQSYGNQNKLFLQSFEAHRIPSEEGQSETQQTYGQSLAEHRIRESLRNSKVQQAANLHPASEHGSDQVPFLPVAQPDPAPAVHAVELQNERLKQIQTVKASDKQQIQYPMIQLPDQAARTPHGGSQQSEPDNASSGFHRRTESQKMSSDIAPMNPVNLAMLSKKQEEFKDQVKERSFLRFRYPNIDINDKGKLEAAYGAAAIRHVVRPYKLATTKASHSGSRERSRAKLGEAPASHPVTIQQTQIHARETLVNSIDQGAFYDVSSRKTSFKVRDRPQPKTFQASAQTTAQAGGFQVVKSHPRQFGGSLSPLARKSAGAPSTGPDGGQPILNISIPSATIKKKKGGKDGGKEDGGGSAAYLRSGSPEISVSAKHVERGRGNTEVKQNAKGRNLSSMKGQTEQRKPKVKNRLEKNREGQKEIKMKETQPAKRSFDLRDYKLDTLGTRLRKFDQVEESIRRYHQPEVAEAPQETSIERYYRLYVHDGPDSIKNAPQPQYTEKFKAQLAMAASKRHNLEGLEMKGVTKEGYQKAVNDLNRLLSLQDTLSLAERSQEARAVLHTHRKGCDCPAHGNKLMEQRLKVDQEQSKMESNKDLRKSLNEGTVGAKPAESPERKEQFSFLTEHRPCCRKSCSTVHNPMLHQKRFNQVLGGAMPETDPKRIAQAVKKAEKEVKKQKLDRLSFGLMNLLEEKQNQLNAMQSMSIEEDSQQVSLAILDHNSPVLKLQEVNSGQTLETQQPASKIKSGRSPLKLLLKKSIDPDKQQKAPTNTAFLNQPSHSQLGGSKKTKSKDSIRRKTPSKDTARKNQPKEATKQSREIVSFPQVEIIQQRQRRSASKEILGVRRGGRKRAQKQFSNLSQDAQQQEGEKVGEGAMMINVASSHSMESYVEREVRDIVAEHKKKSQAQNSIKYESSKHDYSPKSNVKFDLPQKKIKTKTRPKSPGSGSVASKTSRLSSHGLNLTKVLKSSLRKKVLDNQKTSQSKEKDGDGKETKKEKKKKKKADTDSQISTVEARPVFDDEPKTYERIKYEEELAREKNKQEKLRQETQKIKDALATRFAQTLQGQLPLFNKLKGLNNDDLSVTPAKNRSIDVTASLEMSKMFDLASRHKDGGDTSKDDIVNIGKTSSIQRSVQPTLDPKFETSEPPATLSASPSKSVVSENKVQQALFKKLMTIMDKAEGKQTKVLTEMECRNYYLVLREPALRAEVTAKQSAAVKRKVMKTLEDLMNSLMLEDDFKVIQESLKKAANADQAEKRVRVVPKGFMEDRENERLIKLLLRCLRVFDAKERTLKILQRAKNREELKENLMESLADMPADEVRDNYQSLLKTSCKIYYQIETLRADHAHLNRPFMYQGVNLQPAMIKEQVDTRNHILSTHPQVKKDAVSLVLDKQGRIVHYYQIVEGTKKKMEEELRKKMLKGMAKAAGKDKETT